MKRIYLLLFESFIIFCKARRAAKNSAALYTNSKDVNIISDGKELANTITNAGKIELEAFVFIDFIQWNHPFFH